MQPLHAPLVPAQALRPARGLHRSAHTHGLLHHLGRVVLGGRAGHVHHRSVPHFVDANEDRDAANRSVCNCIQQAADSTLSNRDQRRAAGFFKNPEKAHRVWMSKSKGDDAFWDRYKAFGAQAETLCGAPAPEDLGTSP